RHTRLQGDWSSDVCSPIYPFIGAFAALSLILFWLWSPLGWIGTVMTVWCALFFRDPVRVTPVRDGILVAPADGRISRIANANPQIGRASCRGRGWIWVGGG